MSNYKHEYEQLQDQLYEQLPYAQIIHDARTVDEIMEEENRHDTQKLARDSATIREIMGDISELIDDDGEQLIIARGHVEGSEVNVEGAVEQMIKARKSQASSIVLKGTLIGALIGLCIGGPSGAGIGYVVGNAALGGAIIGGLSLGGIFGGLSNSVYRKRAR
jgi:hypothetical protein